MNPSSLSYAAYWRTSLADAELGKGALSKRDSEAFLQASLAQLDAGCLDADLVATLFQDEKEDIEMVDLVIRPMVFLCLADHGQERRSFYPPVLSPLIGKARLRRDGKMYASAQTVVPRDLLEPLERGSFSIGLIATQDAFLTLHAAPVNVALSAPEGEQADAEHLRLWTAYLAYCKRQLSAVAAHWQPDDGNFLSACHWLLAKANSASGASAHILALYDHIRGHNPASALFERFAALTPALLKPCLAPNAGISARVGHASDQYPLADAQRDSLIHLLASEAGSILAVNGPPGTGKTTMLLSVVATRWVQAALDKSEPPVIFAASTNNQAVTNVIDAFGKDFARGDGPLAGRWLPNVYSFGAYMPSRDKEKKAAGAYQMQAFFDTVESTAYVARAQSHYLQQAGAAFPELAAPGVATVLERLHQALAQAAAQLAAIDSSWSALVHARAVLRSELGDHPGQVLAEHAGRCSQRAAENGVLLKARSAWQGYQAEEPMWLSLFSWLPPVAHRRLLRARMFLESVLGAGAGLGECRDLKQLDALLASRIDSAAGALAAQQATLLRLNELAAAEEAAAAQWGREAGRLGSAEGAAMTLAECDRLLDTRLRFDMFRLATHYWEGRWLMDMQALGPQLAQEKKKNGAAALKARWQRRMKLTPCAVSTFFMLPSLMKISRHEAGVFVADYLYNFIDLLIVDEAGQVLPEVAAASFALAKTALVIGDTQQIEPIWSAPHRVDVGNMLKHQLFAPGAGEEAYEAIANAGKAAASGSVMRVAQCASSYHYDPELERGMFLNEHRRCYDDIISYCNRLCYKDKLAPKRGARPAGPGLPALAYLHIDGLCEERNGGSRFNTLEARTIAAWLKANQATLEARYARPLREIVGLVTPFGAQVRALQQACREAGIAAGDSDEAITVGTVHALQGAERFIVIFSPVYSKHADGPFIDRSLSMLNVAVSRAKDSFLVFGDMDLFDPRQGGTPRGLLASYLLADAASALVFETGKRADLARPGAGSVSQLCNAAEHDAFLLDALGQAVAQVQIVTPWASMQRIREIGAWDAMAAAVARGVAVHVYTDEHFNVGEGDAADMARRRAELELLLTALQRGGVHAALVNKVHSKIVVADGTLYCVGSFNWFSASRNKHHARHETSLVYRGSGLEKEIEVTCKHLAARTSRYYDPAACIAGSA